MLKFGLNIIMKVSKYAHVSARNPQHKYVIAGCIPIASASK